MIYIIILISSINLVLLAFLLFRKIDFSGLVKEISKTNDVLKQEMALNREEMRKTLRENREEQANSFRVFEGSVRSILTENGENSKNQSEKMINKLDEKLRYLMEENSKTLNELRNLLDQKIKNLTEENAKKLDEMRLVVDEKLQTTLEKRFNESFKLISDRLEQVHKGLGEMQSVTFSVNELRKSFLNVKSRGVIGEVQLTGILEEILPPKFFIKNAQVKFGTNERVEYAVKLPGNSDDDTPLLLPIDSKFPIEDYIRLIEATESALTREELLPYYKAFDDEIKKNAKVIRDKYINPPSTTDFAIMFVPSESIYSEITKRDELFYHLYNNLKILVVGPINLAAFLNSLSFGFRTLTVQKHSQDVWKLLGDVKNQFGKFGDLLAKTKKNLESSTKVIDEAEQRTRMIEKKLNKVQSVPAQQEFEFVTEDDGGG